MKAPLSIILASKSPRRLELLSRLNRPFTVEAADVVELESGTSPRLVPEFNARLKAAAVAGRHPGAVVIGADTAIVFDGKLIGKPRDIADAERLLLGFSGRTHEVITGVALIALSRQVDLAWSVVSAVTFKKLDLPAIRRYFALVDVLDKAGAYALQEHGELIIATASGDPDNIVGLPLERLTRELAALD